ncbi:MAG TPA: SiaB family protein kinase, partial [Rectinemataceae bacterium]|nr:SiaB family protein kinase [Rectinemataceae bacterium]
MAAPALDIYGLRKSLIESDILICFNGPFSHSIIEEIGTAVRRYLESDAAPSSAMTDVFAVFVELAQNVQAYTSSLRGADGGAGLDAGTLVIGRAGDRYALSSGNA